MYISAHGSGGGPVQRIEQALRNDLRPGININREGAFYIVYMVY